MSFQIFALLLITLVGVGSTPPPPAVTKIVLPLSRCQLQCASEQAHLRRLDLLESFTFVSKGCYGTCPAYYVIFNRNGVATISNIQFVPELKRLNGQGTANVPFAKIRTLLASSQFATLAPQYPLRAMDVWGVSLGWVYSDGFSYGVDAPDKNTWPESLGSLVTAVMQLVRDTNWH